MRHNRRHQGFILPLSVLLVIVLGVSGMTFLQLEFGERRRASGELDRHGAFYLANAGVQRARETLKIPTSEDGLTSTWTPVLDGSDGVLDAEYPTDPDPDLRLCPDPAVRGCVIPPFQTAALNPALRADGVTPVIVADGDPVIPADFPFGDTFDRGLYTVRVYNNEPSLIDADQALTVRALGQLQGREKLVEVNVLAISDLRLLNCLCGIDEVCPEDTNGNPVILPSEGREPACYPALPFLDPPLSDPDNFYRQPDNFPTLTYRPIDDCAVPGQPMKLTATVDPGDPTMVAIEGNSLYLINCDVIVQNSGSVDNIVIFSTGGNDVKTGVTLNNAIVIGADWVRLRGGVTISHMLETFPAVISGGGGIQADANVNVFGNIYSEGTVDFNSGDFHGMIIGQDVEVQGGQGALYTDDGDLSYYAVMPGFAYSDDLKATIGMPNTWREDP